MPHIGPPRPLRPQEQAEQQQLMQEVLEEERETLAMSRCNCGAPKTPGEFWCPRCLHHQGDFLEEDL